MPFFSHRLLSILFAISDFSVSLLVLCDVSIAICTINYSDDFVVWEHRTTVDVRPELEKTRLGDHLELVRARRENEHLVGVHVTSDKDLFCIEGTHEEACASGELWAIDVD